MNINCTICTDLYKSSDTVVSSSCGHCFHSHCLTQWLEVSETCPECRSRCTQADTKRIFWNTSVAEPLLLKELKKMKLEAREKDATIEYLERKIEINKARYKKDAMKSAEETFRKRIDDLTLQAREKDAKLYAKDYEIEKLNCKIKNENLRWTNRLAELRISTEIRDSAYKREIEELRTELMIQSENKNLEKSVFFITIGWIGLYTLYKLVR